MTFTKIILVFACLMCATLVAQEAQVTPLLSKDLTNLPGKEGLMITVVYPPGSSDPIHRHNAHAFVYVLEGSVVMQLRNATEVTLSPGQTFYEGPLAAARPPPREARVAGGSHELRPLGRAAMEGVEIHIRLDAGHSGLRRVLPHQPGPVRVALVRLGRDAAHPMRVFRKLALEHVPVE